jgi:hypothetical protein
MCIVPKFSLIDSWLWFHLFLNYLYLVALLKLKGVLCIYVLLSMKDKLKTIYYVFPYDLNTHLTFTVSLFMIFCLCSISCYNMVAKFLLSRLCLACPCFKFFDLSTQCFTYMIKIVMMHVTSKIISFVITYLLEDEQELSLRMLIRLKRIYNFWCSMLVFTPFAFCFVTLRGIFMRFLELTYWQDDTVPVPCFLLFLCFRKVTQKIFSELDKTSSWSLIFPGSFQRSEEAKERGHRPASQ